MRRKYYYKDSNWRKLRLWFKGLGHGGCSCYDDPRHTEGSKGAHWIECRLITAKVRGK